MRYARQAGQGTLSREARQTSSRLVAERSTWNRTVLLSVPCFFLWGLVASGYGLGLIDPRRASNSSFFFFKTFTAPSAGESGGATGSGGTAAPTHPLTVTGDV